MEGDPLDKIPVLTHPRISIHSLRMEGDLTTNHGVTSARVFQSTPSAWRETE